ncbi:MAG: hypothetical protein IJP25_04385 [Elusimicrobiaceae bacterium]|nr:hypothetical protein [Elusimicrobiaceae bacterium]
MVFHHLQPSFSGGEVAPALHARSDSPSYGSWLKTARNFYVHPQGGASNRPGTLFMGSGKGKCRLIPFVLSEEEAYVLEMGEKYLRVFTAAGQLLNEDGSVYELSVPYGTHEVSAVRYAQYEQTLFLTHPNHPPKKLVRVSAGQFELVDLPIRYGPFKPTNTDETRHLRLVKYHETVVSQGACATCAFLPEVDARYFVQAYFKGELFFSGRDFGLDLSFLVSEFNRQYAAQGCTATHLGGVIKITSPVETGGDWNGVELVLEYRNSFAGSAVWTVVQTLSGGANRGSEVPLGEQKYLLESDFDIFSPQHIGGRFSLLHPVESQFLTGTLGYEDISGSVKTAGDWRLVTAGSWTGSLALEISQDLGASWQQKKTFSRAEGEENLSTFGQLDDTEGMYLVRLRALSIVGEAAYELQAESFLQEGVAVVRDFITPRQAAVEIEREYGNQDWTVDWAEGAFSPKAGYPACVFFYQNRLGLAGTKEEGQTVWFSKTGEFANFGHARATVREDDSFCVTLAGKTLNAIRSVMVSGRLLVFTAGSEWSISSSGALTPYNVQVEQLGERGSFSTPCILVGNRALFVQARGGVLRDFVYDYNSASYTGNDLTLYAKHLFFHQEITDMAYQQEPDNLVWCVLSGGKLASLTYLPQQNLCAWTHHETQGAFKSICVVPNRGYDEVWLAVERANGYCIERLVQRLASKEPQDQLFLDSAVSRKGTESFTEITGLSHLEGCSVGIFADGNPSGEQVVLNGKITLPRAANCVHAGLTYAAELQTLPVVLEGSNGTLADRQRRLVSVTVKMLDSRGGRIGTREEALEEILQRSGEKWGEPIPLKTQEYRLNVSAVHGLTPGVLFKQTDPLPVTILAVVSRLV